LVKIYEVASIIRRQLAEEIKSLPTDFYDTFNYVKTGTNRCHAVTIWLLARAVSAVPGVKYGAIDVRLNLGGGVKLQPDIVGYGVNNSPVVLIDFESPNSSDARIKPKDVDPYLAWCKGSGWTPPYLIVTSLPSRPREPREWFFKYHYGNQYNSEHHGNGEAVMKSPLAYWSEVWRKQLSQSDLSHIGILNIDGKRIHRLTLAEH
jgi:hypothetical protein